MNDKTERMSAADFRQRVAGGDPKKVQPAHYHDTSQSLYQGTKATWMVGIDPGTNTGWALWYARKGNEPGYFKEVDTLTFWAAVRRLERIVKLFGPTTVRLRIEDPNGNRPVFDKGEAGAKRREKIAQNVGSNKRDAQLWIALAEDLGVPYDAVVPQARAGGKGKVGMEYFKGVEGFPARCSQHARDASALILGM